MLQPISYVLRNLLALVVLTGPVCFIDRAWGYVSATNAKSYPFDTRRQRGPLPGPAASSSGDHSQRSYSSYGLQNQPIQKRLNRTQRTERSHSYKQKPRRLILLTNGRHTKYIPDDQRDQNKFLPENIQRFDKHGRSRSNHHRPGVHLLHKIITTKRSSTTTQRTSQTSPLVTSSSTVTSPTTTATTVLTTLTMSSSTAAPDSTMGSTTTEATTSSSTAITESTTFASSDDPTSPSTAISTSAADTTLRPCRFKKAKTGVLLADSVDGLFPQFPDRYVAIQPPFATLLVQYVIRVVVDATGTTGSRTINFYTCAGRDIGVNNQINIFTGTTSDTPFVTVGTGTGAPVGPYVVSAEHLIIDYIRVTDDCIQSASIFTIVTCVGDPKGSCNNIADSCPPLGTTVSS